MPCYITGSAAGDAELAAKEAREEAQKVTRLLCNLLERLENGSPTHYFTYVPIKVDRWWQAHKEIDKERKEREAKEKKRKEIDKKVKAYRKILELGD